MSTNRDPDRLIRAWLDLMPSEAPDRAVSAVLQAVETTRQVRALPRLGRWRFPMNRLSVIATATLVIAALVGGVYLIGSGGQGLSRPTAAPTATPGPTQAEAPAPESLWSTWIAETGASASPGTATTRTRLVISASGTVSYVVDAGVETLYSRPSTNQSGELVLTSNSTAGGCQVGDVGRYSYAFGSDGTVPNSDGTLLALTVVADTCAARSSVLNRGWSHAIDADSMGGRGVSTAFSPMFLITLPAATYTSGAGPDSMSATSATPDRTLFALHNPVGRTEPCSTNGGSKLPIDPTIAAFTAYLRTLPGFTVQSSELTIDGHAAVLLTVPTVSTTDCPSHRVNEWTTSDSPEPGGWHLNQGDTDVIYLVEVDGDLVLLQWLGSGVTTAEEQSLFATIRFTTTLPQ